MLHAAVTYFVTEHVRRYYRDHVCLMDSDELGDFELILGCTSKDLAAYVR
jgi:succinate dehydrogenase flavin-adding protein (antitoxin of CptAB toxin-antitoxin module)